MEIAVIGKHPSVESYPKKLFRSFKHTMGLNHAAITFNTRFALWMQINFDTNLSQCKCEKVITISKPPDAKVPFPPHFEIFNYYNCGGNINREIVNDLVYHSAGLKDMDFKYTGHNTCLHLALFWCFINNFTHIHLFGCNNKPVDGDGWNWKGAHRTTQEIIDEASNYGISINWWMGHKYWKRCNARRYP